LGLILAITVKQLFSSLGSPKLLQDLHSVTVVLLPASNWRELVSYAKKERFVYGISILTYARQTVANITRNKLQIK
jgi:hypothetical protein